MRVALAVGCVLAIAACEPPSPSLQLRLAGGPAQPCPSTSCLEIGMACETWMSIRIIDPADPRTPYLSQCGQVPPNGRDDLCSLGNVNLAATPLPYRDLEIQVAVYPETAIEIDPLTGEGTCPTDVQYDAVNGFPVESASTPALGGRGYYRPGDAEVVVTLGCTNLEALNEATCVGAATVSVSATVEDFDLRLALDSERGPAAERGRRRAGALERALPAQPRRRHAARFGWSRRGTARSGRCSPRPPA